MLKFKDYLFIGCLLILAVIMEVIRESHNIPVTLIDLIFFPGAIIFSVVFLRYEFFNKKNLAHYNLFEPISIARRLGIFLASLLMLMAGLGCIWWGVHEPLTYFSGVKGAGHGYTLVAIGIFLFIMGAYGITKFAYIEFIKSKDE